MPRFWTLCLFLTLMLVLVSCTSPRAPENSGMEEGKTDPMEMARSAWILEDFDKIIEVLEPAINIMEDVSKQAEASLLLGKAYFMRAEETVSHMSTQSRMFQAIPSQTATDFLKAYGYFMDAAWIAQDKELLVEIYYFAGKTQDAGYLQDFKKASEHYKSAFSISPTHEYGAKALERYALLAKWFEMYNIK